MTETEVMDRLKQQNAYIDGVIKYHEKVIQDLAAMRNENKKLLAGMHQANDDGDILRLFYETGFTTGSEKRDEQLSRQVKEKYGDRMSVNQIRQVINNVMAAGISRQINNPAAYLITALDKESKEKRHHYPDNRHIAGNDSEP